MLAIEINDDSHDMKVEYDKRRQTKLELLGICFLRFSDLDVKRNMEGMIGTIGTIESWILGNKPTLPCGLRSQEGNKPTSGFENKRQSK